MTRKSILACVLTGIFLLASGTAFAQETSETHAAHVGINPFGWLYGAYRVEAGVPLNQYFEIAGQLNYFNAKQFRSLWGADTDNYNNRLTTGGVFRLFPGGESKGFFVSGRLMYLQFTHVEDGIEDSTTDVSAGVDLGWRIKFSFDAPVGMFVQSFLGLERFILSGGDIGDYLPILPVAGLHLGVTF